VREILFRAKRIDNGEWVEGYYVKTTLGKDIEPSDVIFVPWNINRSEQWGWIKVLTETLCQYTGLKDKNDNRIWENDIVEDKRFDGFYKVVFRVRDGGWYVENLKTGALFRITESTSYQYEICGNCFDNLEVLKGE